METASRRRKGHNRVRFYSGSSPQRLTIFPHLERSKEELTAQIYKNKSKLASALFTYQSSIQNTIETPRQQITPELSLSLTAFSYNTARVSTMYNVFY